MPLAEKGRRVRMDHRGGAVMVSREDELKAARLGGEQAMTELLHKHGISGAYDEMKRMMAESALETSRYRARKGRSFLTAAGAY